jgi:hypothetical protein
LIDDETLDLRGRDLPARLATVVRFANAEQCIDVRRDTASWA